ncbi:hypothetical protein PROFUN_14595 [Planoprotostelium fungivorum]|uniref:Uncharacterized protein n=1 Tax=Planoprotostelium fungivorum TaxID=1890364 RepID=A0A2P6MZE5_9EUKA|nr:hypothetical protein PROFUN_14595 [Planoprotostelium fungivorum]
MKARDANLKDRDGVIFSKLPTNSLSTRLRSTHMEESERQDGVDIQWLYLLMNLRVPATTASSQNHPTPSKNFPPSHHRVLGLDYSLYSRKWAEQTLKETEEKYYWEVNSAEEVHKLFHQNAEGDIDRIEYEDPKFATIIHRVKLGEILKSEPRGRLQSRLCINRDGSNVLYKRRNEETWTERLSLSGVVKRIEGLPDVAEDAEEIAVSSTILGLWSISLEDLSLNCYDSGSSSSIGYADITVRYATEFLASYSLLSIVTHHGWKSTTPPTLLLWTHTDRMRYKK